MKNGAEDRSPTPFVGTQTERLCSGGCFAFFALHCLGGNDGGDGKASFAAMQRAIDLLQERRTALISAAVTGQIDVRHIVRESNHAENHL